MAVDFNRNIHIFFTFFINDKMKTKIAIFLFLVAGTVTTASNDNSDMVGPRAARSKSPLQPPVKRVRRSSPSPPHLASTASENLEIEPNEVAKVNPDLPDGGKGKLLKLSLKV